MHKKLQKQYILMVVPAFLLFLAFVAVVCEFPRFYAAAILLLGLYALYYYYPSQRRIGFDKKIFRVT